MPELNRRHFIKLVGLSAGAAAAVRAHLNYVEQALRDQQTARRNEDVARQRLAHEQETR